MFLSHKTSSHKANTKIKIVPHQILVWKHPQNLKMQWKSAIFKLLELPLDSPSHYISQLIHQISSGATRKVLNWVEMEDFKLELTLKCFCTFPSSRPSIFLLTSFIHSASSCRRPSRWHSGCGAGDHFTASFWNNSKSCNNLALLIVTTTETASVLKWFLANYNSYASWFGLRNKFHATTASAYAAHNLLFAI